MITLHPIVVCYLGVVCGVILTGGRFPRIPNTKVGVGDLDPGIKAGEETQKCLLLAVYQYALLKHITYEFFKVLKLCTFKVRLEMVCLKSFHNLQILQNNLSQFYVFTSPINNL